jgi:carbonic anhydrase
MVSFLLKVALHRDDKYSQRRKIMAPIQIVRNESEAWDFAFQESNLPGPSDQKITVLMRTGNCIDLLVLSDIENHARMFPNVGTEPAQALDALIASGALPDTSAIMVIHHADCDLLPSRYEDRCRELSTHSGQAGILSRDDLERSVRDVVAFLMASPLIPKNTAITGLLYDVRSCSLSPVTSNCDQLQTYQERT